MIEYIFFHSLTMRAPESDEMDLLVLEISMDVYSVVCGSISVASIDREV